MVEMPHKILTLAEVYTNKYPQNRFEAHHFLALELSSAVTDDLFAKRAKESYMKSSMIKFAMVRVFHRNIFAKGD